MKKYFLMNDEECVFDSCECENLNDAIEEFKPRYGGQFKILEFDDSLKPGAQDTYHSVNL